MTTHNTHPEYNDVDGTVVESVPVSETITTPPTPDFAVSNEGDTTEQSDLPLAQFEDGNTENQDLVNIATFTETITVGNLEPETPVFSAEGKGKEEVFVSDSTTETPLLVEEEVRPFTEFIEEFRQSEALSAHTPIADMVSSDFVSPWESALPFVEETNAPGSLELAIEVNTTDELIEAKGSDSAAVTETEVSPQINGETPGPIERPVSPLLRPASRLRIPRHGVLRPREESILEKVEPVVQVPPAEVPVTTEQPQRRYRFDRRGSTPSSVSLPPTPTSAPLRTNGEDGKDVLNRSTTITPIQARPEPAQSVEREAQASAQKIMAQPDVQETPVVENGSTTKPSAPDHDRRRRHGQERQREKDQGTQATSTDTGMQLVAPVTDANAATKEEISPEDLPPLEYSELQAASSRRRRRRRGSAPGAVSLNAASLPKTATPEGVSPTLPTDSPGPSVALPRATAPGLPATQYNIVSGYTMSQMNQGTDGTAVGSGPFMGPEPSPARGSTMSREVRTVRTEVQRSATYPAGRAGEVLPASASSVNQLASVISQAIQLQTDRMVAELRRANQSPTNISVSMPPFPSTERVGVFVDVANLLYSARTLRMTVDFGKLLDFLRGNRRLVRAHAYCPTSPQPGDEQMFLQAVKGLGYRITTKNYKTFSSGAKKADLDLDLCMDVVRLVDGRAVDCIVLVSGDSDFMPMLDYCSDHGVRVEVAAFDEAMSATLRQSCDLFINLSMLEEIRS